MNNFKNGDLVRVIGIGNGEVIKVRFDDLNNPIYNIELFDGTIFYARESEIYLDTY